jgi:putative lipoic acid-binding regulatory protein
MLDGPSGGPQIEFPLDWEGRVLARADAAAVPAQIGQVLRAFGLAAEPVPVNRSSQGRYVTYAVRLTIPDRVAWQQLCYALSRIEGVRSVF